MSTQILRRSRQYGLIGLFILSVSAYGQRGSDLSDDINDLDTVHLAVHKLRDFSVGQRVHRVTVSALNGNRPALGSFLNYATPIYFKENGLGMVSSPSFRGTTASQTAVIWNGISINSNFTGQVDFNTISTRSYDEVDIRSGGGSLLYGSSAVGGIIHLQTDLKFNRGMKNELYSGYGSFNTWDNKYRFDYSSRKWSFRLVGLQNRSANDYPYPKRSGRNKNGQYKNYTIDGAVGYRLNAQNTFYAYHQLYRSNRHFPVFYTSETPTKYKDYSLRTLLEWDSRFGEFYSNLKAAFLREEYNYYPNIELKRFSYGKTSTFIGDYNLRYQVHDRILINGLIDFQYTKGQGTDIGRDNRNITSFGLLLRHDLSSKWRYQIGGRKEITAVYESPFLYSFGMDYEANDFYGFKISASKNFRRPTFNDLFWTNAGNLDLKAEQSNQIEIGNHLSYKDWKLNLTAYFNDIKDMIHWLPASNGIFKPRNEDHVQTYGLESFLGWQKSFNDHFIQLNATYAYTVSKDKKTNNQLIYVPYHKLTFAVEYHFKRFYLDYQILSNSKVFLRSDNDPSHTLSGYTLSNLGVAYAIDSKKHFKVGGKIRNLFDLSYENVERFEMPGINFNIFINLNF